MKNGFSPGYSPFNPDPDEGGSDDVFCVRCRGSIAFDYSGFFLIIPASAANGLWVAAATLLPCPDVPC